MTRKPLVLAGLCVALFAAPALAQQSPGGTMPPSSTMPASPHTGMTKTSPTKPKAATAQHKVRRVAQAKRRSCYDLAWQSQAMKDCLARHPQEVGQIETAPNGTPIIPGGSPTQ